MSKYKKWGKKFIKKENGGSPPFFNVKIYNKSLVF